jgi:hypothetical protein
MKKKKTAGVYAENKAKQSHRLRTDICQQIKMVVVVATDMSIEIFNQI